MIFLQKNVGNGIHQSWFSNLTRHHHNYIIYHLFIARWLVDMYRLIYVHQRKTAPLAILFVPKIIGTRLALTKLLQKQKGWSWCKTKTTQLRIVPMDRDDNKLRAPSNPASVTNPSVRQLEFFQNSKFLTVDRFGSFRTASHMRDLRQTNRQTDRQKKKRGGGGGSESA